MVREKAEQVGSGEGTEWRFTMFQEDAFGKKIKVKKATRETKFTSVKEIIRWKLMMTFLQMRDQKLIEDKLVSGSPRTRELFKAFLGDHFREEQKSPRFSLKKKREDEKALHRKFMQEYGFLRRIMEDGQPCFVTKQMVQKLFAFDKENMPVNMSLGSPENLDNKEVTETETQNRSENGPISELEPAKQIVSKKVEREVSLA